MQQLIIEALGIDLLPEAEQEQAMTQWGGLVFTAVMSRALDQLSEGDQQEFERMMDAGEAPEKLFSYLGEKVPNFAEIVKEETKKVQKESEEMLGKYGM